MKNPRRIAKERQLAEIEEVPHDAEPNRLEFIVGLVSKTATVESVGVEKSLTVRVPLHLSLRIDALAASGSMSRNTLCCQLLEYAVEDVMGELDEITLEFVQNHEGEALGRFMKGEAE